MPLSVSANELLEFKLQGFFNGAQELNNIFHYQVTTVGGATLLDFATGLWRELSSSLLDLTNNAVEYVQIVASKLDTDGNLVNGESYIIHAGDGVGVTASDALPPFVTWTFKYIRPDSSFRHGFKRFAGVSENSQAEGIIDSGALSVLIPPIETSLAATIAGYSRDVDNRPDTVVGSSAMQPVVVQRIVNGDPISPVNLAVIADVVFDKIGTQNSRKYGRGS